MEFGYVLAGQNLATDDPRQRFLEAVEQVRAARAAGFTSLWTTQHFLADFQFMQPIPFLARLAAEAEGMTLVSSIIISPLYPTVLLAEEVATLDVICGGRFVLGVGAGYRDVEFTSIGVPKRERFDRLADGIDTLRRLWSGDVVDKTDGFASLDGVRMVLPPLQGDRLPIWVGAQGPTGLAIAARHGDDWLVSPEVSLPVIKERQQVYRDALPPDVDPSTKLYPTFREAYVAASREDAVRAARAALETKYAAYAAWGNPVGSFEELVESSFILGSVEDCVASARRYEAETGTSVLGLRMQWPGLEQRAVLDSIAAAGDLIAAFESER